MRPRRTGSPIGFTLAELLIAISIIGILTAVSMPRLNTVRTQAALSGATTRFTRAVMAARQAAIQQGKRSYFKTKNNQVWVVVDPTGVPADSIIITKAISLSSLYGVTVESPSGLTSIDFDPRGVSNQVSKQSFTFKHANSGRMDSLCVSRLGNTIRERCP